MSTTTEVRVPSVIDSKPSSDGFHHNVPRGKTGKKPDTRRQCGHYFAVGFWATKHNASTACQPRITKFSIDLSGILVCFHLAKYESGFLVFIGRRCLLKITRL